MINENENQDAEIDPLADDFDDEPFADFESGKGGNSIGDMMRNNPLFKVGVILGGFVLIVGGIILFSGGKNPDSGPSVVPGGKSQLSETPGTTEISSSYRDAIDESNVQDVEKAVKEGGSSLPIPTTPPVGVLPTTPDQVKNDDPLERWKRIQEERQQRATPIVAEEPAQQDNSREMIDGLSEAMARQMESIMSRLEPQPAQIKKITSPEYLEAKAQQTAVAQQAIAAQQQATAQQQQTVEIIVPAGTIEYGQLLIEANSDVPGPVLAMVASGPLSGSRLIGSFAVQDEYLTLVFNTVVYKGISSPIQAIALDPKTTLGGMATEVDRRYLKRVILPAAAAFIEGIGSAIADQGSTNVTVSGDTVIQNEEDLNTREEVYKGVEEAADKIGQELDKQASQTKVLVRVAAGTPMGIFFLQPVTKQPGQ